MPTSLLQQISRVTTGKLNTVNDADIGTSVASPTGLPRYGGQIGAVVVLGKDEVKYDSSIGTLYGGIYQYVRTKAASTAAPARGLIAFYANLADIQAFQVTPDAPAGNGCLAGVYISAPTKGYYCWIQTGGLASVQFTAQITRATPAAQDLVVIKANDNVADQEEAATTVTVNMLARTLGVAAETPVGGAIKLVQLWERFLNI